MMQPALYHTINVSNTIFIAPGADGTFDARLDIGKPEVILLTGFATVAAAKAAALRELAMILVADAEALDPFDPTPERADDDDLYETERAAYAHMTRA